MTHSARERNLPSSPKPQIVGTSAPRKEGPDKVTGAAQYVDDMRLPGMLYGATVRSKIARGRIKGISFDQAMHWNEFVIATAKDIPGHNCISLILDDQPCLADGVINHPEEPLYGAGKAASAPVAAALANAVYDACGTRVRRLPLTPVNLDPAR